MRRVVVTGMGLVTPLGIGLERNWSSLVEGSSGVRAIQSFDVSDLPVKIAAQVPRGETASGLFNADDWVPPKDQRKMDGFIVYALAAAAQAVEDAGWTPQDEEARERTGVMIGSGIGGLPGITDGALTLHERGPRRLSPFFIPANLINLASGHVSIRYGFTGPNHAVVTACSTGAHAIGDAARLIMLDDADVMVCGGTEAAICRLGLAGFASARALSTGFNDDPPRASRPWDQERDGFVMGEGAGILVLEEYEHARRRGAKIYAEVIGYGMSGDAFHLTAPAEDGNGAFRSMRNALRRAGIDAGQDRLHQCPRHLDPARRRDRAGCGQAAVRRHAYKLSMSSTKSAIGHLLGAAGSVEAIFAILAIRDGVVPPTLNLDNPSPVLRHRSGAEAGQGAQGKLRALQFLRLWRHQCLADLCRAALSDLSRVVPGKPD